MSDTDTKTKMIEYIRILKSIEDEMEPYKEAKRELRQDFRNNGWLTKEQISNITRAYRMLKANEDIEEFVDAYNALTGEKSIAGDDSDDA